MTTRRKTTNNPGLSVIKSKPPQKEESSPESCLVDLDVWETPDLKNSTGMLFRCREENAMGLLIGPPGSGKTTIINSFHQRFNDTVVVTAGVAMALKDFLEAVAEAVDLNVYGSNGQRFKQIAEELTRRPVTLIIDETENLITRTSITKLEVLRQLHDTAGVGVVFCGTPRLEELITRGPSGRENLAQLYSRIIYRFKLSGIKNKEVTEILKSYPIDKAAGEELTAIAAGVNRGGIRMFSNVLSRCLSIIRNDGTPAITKDVITQATSMMLL